MKRMLIHFAGTLSVGLITLCGAESLANDSYDPRPGSPYTPETADLKLKSVPLSAEKARVIILADTDHLQ